MIRFEKCLVAFNKKVCIIINVYKDLSMSKKEKLVQAIVNNPTNVKFEELKKILESIGYTSINRGGSHYVFTQKGCPSLTIPYKRPVKVVYVKQVIQIIEEHECENKRVLSES